MKQLKEIHLGNITPKTFRPTEAQKAVLSHIDSMIASGRNVTEQDAINIPHEVAEERELSRQNLASAFHTLVNLELITISPDDTINITDAGNAIVDEIKKTSGETSTLFDPKFTEPDINLDTADDFDLKSDLDQKKGPFENLELIRYLNDFSKVFLKE